MGKALDALIKRENTIRRKTRMSRYKSPFDCPKCMQPKCFHIKKHKQDNTSKTWFIFCEKCDVHLNLTTKLVMTLIDVLNTVMDMNRSGEI